jgi:hypothetical protein
VPGKITTPSVIGTGAVSANLYIGAGTATGCSATGGSTIIQGGHGDIGTGGSGPVQIQTGSDTGNPDFKYTWTFDEQGRLLLPNAYSSGGTLMSADGFSFYNTNTFQYPRLDTANIIVPPNGSTDSIQVNNNNGNVQLSSNTNTWKFGTDGILTLPGNLILPAGGQIQSPAGTGNVTIEANDGNNARTWAFTTNGNIHIPSVQYTDFVNIDATVSNVQTIGQNAYIEFGTFSGEILVNDLTDGYMYKILVGSGKCAVIGSTNSSWTTAAPGVAVTIASYIKIEFTGGKYRFTNLAPSRDYNFYTIKTRNHS